jgi:hypothetical protein
MDRFTFRPLVIAVVIWIGTVLPVVLSENIYLLLAALIVAITALVAVITFVVYVLKQQWRKVLSVVSAAGLFMGISSQAMHYSDELRWLAFQSYYKRRIAESIPTPDGIKGTWWRGGSGWDVSLEYHEDEAAAREWQKKQERFTEAACRYSPKELAPHYFLNGMYC